MQIKAILSIIILSSLISACTTPGRNVIPKGGSLTMSELYHREMGAGATVPSLIRRKEVATTDIGTANNVRPRGLRAFKALKNPLITLYVYPHFVAANGESLPKPGLNTEFFLYRETPFALPSERY